MAASAPVTVRNCRPADLERILEIERESFTDPYDMDTFSWILSNEPEGFLVAEREGNLLGYIAVVTSGGVGMVYSIATDPRSKRTGIGRRLMEASLRYLSAKVNLVYLQVRVSNEAAIAMYKSFSFVAKRRMKKYYADGEDAYLMTRDLTTPGGLRPR